MSSNEIAEVLKILKHKKSIGFFRNEVNRSDPDHAFREKTASAVATLQLLNSGLETAIEGHSEIWSVHSLAQILLIKNKGAKVEDETHHKRLREANEYVASLLREGRRLKALISLIKVASDEYLAPLESVRKDLTTAIHARNKLAAAISEQKKLAKGAQEEHQSRKCEEEELEREKERDVKRVVKWSSSKSKGTRLLPWDKVRKRV